MNPIMRVPKSICGTRSGKVWDTFPILLCDGGVRRFTFATDRASIYDFQLPFGIPRKGEVLNALTIFWRLRIRKESDQEITDDMLTFGRPIDAYLPERLRGIESFWHRGRIGYELDMIPAEVVTRAYLTGNGYRTYVASLKVRDDESGLLCGQVLPAGLLDGDQLPERLCTPTTKAPRGEHDLDMPIDAFRAAYPGLEALGLRVADIRGRHAASVGLIEADGKDEYGVRKATASPRRYVLADESGTFDACRYWEADDYARSRPRLPRSLSKEHLRNWGKEHGIDKLDPKDPQAVTFVNALPTPYDVIRETTNICMELFERLAGKPIEVFWREDMNLTS